MKKLFLSAFVLLLLPVALPQTHAKGFDCKKDQQCFLKKAGACQSASATTSASTIDPFGISDQNITSTLHIEKKKGVCVLSQQVLKNEFTYTPSARAGFVKEGKSDDEIKQMEAKWQKTMGELQTTCTTKKPKSVLGYVRKAFGIPTDLKMSCGAGLGSGITSCTYDEGLICTTGTPAALAQPQPPADWEQYHDLTLHISFLYPPTYTYVGKQLGPNSWIFELKDKKAAGQPGITVYMNPDGFDLPSPEKTYTAEETSEGRLSLHEVPKSNEKSAFAKDDNLYTIQGFSSRNGNRYFITFNGGKAYEDVFKKMMESFVIEK